MGSGGEAYSWWQRGVIYHIYPRSFQDSNGDGVGDLPGITSRLDYLRDLGVDAIWISPIYPSPMADFGYDVSDYAAIHPLFGTLSDFDTLVREAHARAIRVLLDWVPNHTSVAHPWFVESRSSRESPKRDWYLWRDPTPTGNLPNNWLSIFGGPAWEWDEQTGQYYYHTYLTEQPDLNWRNPQMCEAMLDTLRFWLERGVDGFRIDALRQVVKDDQWRDNSPNPVYEPGMRPYDSLIPLYSTDRPEVHEVVRAVRGVVDTYPERLLIGELYLPIERLMAYYGVDGSGVHMPANFHLLSTQWDARALAALIATYEAALPSFGWPNWVLGNHDVQRVATRIGAAQTRVAAMLLLTLRGTPTLYYGDELGMSDGDIPPSAAHDPVERNLPGLGLGRDPERTPMQWDAGPNAGFTSGAPWLLLAGDANIRNVAVQSADPTSLLTLYRRLLALRRGEAALSVGSYMPVATTSDVLAYQREADGERFLIALNLSPREQTFTLETAALSGRILLSTRLDRESEAVSGAIPLRAHEGMLVRLD